MLQKYYVRWSIFPCLLSTGLKYPLDYQELLVEASHPLLGARISFTLRIRFYLLSYIHLKILNLRSNRCAQFGLSNNRFPEESHYFKHLFASTQCDDFLRDVRRIAADNIGVIVPITKEAATMDEFARTRLGLCR